MYHTKKVYYFQAESKDVCDKWVIVSIDVCLLLSYRFSDTG
jgi:hypothetical protein